MRALKHLPAGGRLLVVDETTLRFLPPLRAAWALCGEQAEVRISGENASCSLFGALDLHTGRRVLMVTPRQRLADFACFLHRLRSGAGAKGALWLLLDSHSTHRSLTTLRLAEQLDIRFFWLPKQSPKLNPVDHLWRGLKGELAANRQFADVDELARYAQAWVYRLTPTQTLRKAGLLSENCWLRKLRKTLWPCT